MGILDDLRAKPERERKQIAVAATVVMWSAIMFVWFTESVLERAPATTQPIGGESPLQAVGSIFGEGIDGIRASVSSARESLSGQKLTP